VKWPPAWELENCSFSPCVPLLLEADSQGTGIVREPRIRGISAVESRYQATVSGNCNRLKILVSV
jgi:hypothetical protein